MLKITTITATLIALLAVGSAFGQGQNLLASGEITLAASTNESTYTQSIGLYDSVRKTDWGRVHAVIVKNNSDFATTTTVARVDLDDLEAALGTRFIDEDLGDEVDTLGGLSVLMAGRVPQAGERFTHPNRWDIEVAASDVDVKQEELVFLQMLEDRFALDKLAVAAIEHSARVRYRKLA